MQKETTRNVNPSSVPGLSAEARKAVNAAFDAMSKWRAEAAKHSEKNIEEVIEKIAEIAVGGGPISYRRLEPDIARTLVAGHRAMPVHPWLHRTISVREAARIQGFEDSYVFCGPRANQPLQVANAVPPPVAAALAARRALKSLR